MKMKQVREHQGLVKKKQLRTQMLVNMKKVKMRSIHLVIVMKELVLGKEEQGM